jgi:large subunit ribosomal protein L9
MKVLLIKDVYNLGRAGEVKKVADGYARNFLIPQKMAVKATDGAMKQIERIQASASKQRELLNEEMSGLAEQIAALELSFKAKVGETGKLYGSITKQMIIDVVNEQLHVNLDRHQIESQPLRETGEHSVRVRLTYDLVPEIKITVEGEEEEQEEQLEETGKKPRSAKIEEIVEAEEIEEAEEMAAAEEAVEEEISDSDDQEAESE